MLQVLARNFEQSAPHGQLRGRRKGGLLTGVSFQIVKLFRRRIKFQYEFEASLADRQNSRAKASVPPERIGATGYTFGNCHILEILPLTDFTPPAAPLIFL